MTGTGAQQLMQKKSLRDLKKGLPVLIPQPTFDSSTDFDSVCWELGNKWIALKQNVKCVKNVTVLSGGRNGGGCGAVLPCCYCGRTFLQWLASGKTISVFSICRMSVSAYLNYKLYRCCLRHTKLPPSHRIVGINSLTVSQFLPWGKWEK